MELIENIKGEHVFESGTIEGLMKLLGDNNETAIGVYDEFATFIDSLDKGMFNYFSIVYIKNQKFQTLIFRTF